MPFFEKVAFSEVPWHLKILGQMPLKIGIFRHSGILGRKISIFML